MKTGVLALVSAMSLALAPVAEACSRATWLGDDGSVITGRSMDWPYDFNTHFYVIPRGFQNEGIKGGLTWASKYGTVVAAGSMTPGGPIDGAFDGVNEKGLGANLLYLAEDPGKYGLPTENAVDVNSLVRVHRDAIVAVAGHLDDGEIATLGHKLAAALDIDLRGPIREGVVAHLEALRQRD